jgi:hypothetical protein
MQGKKIIQPTVSITLILLMPQADISLPVVT